MLLWTETGRLYKYTADVQLTSCTVDRALLHVSQERERVVSSAVSRRRYSAVRGVRRVRRDTMVWRYVWLMVAAGLSAADQRRAYAAQTFGVSLKGQVHYTL